MSIQKRLRMREHEVEAIRLHALSVHIERLDGSAPDRYSLPSRLLLPSIREAVKGKKRTLMDAWKASFAAPRLRK